jgi:hypothetical protein
MEMLSCYDKVTMYLTKPAFIVDMEEIVNKIRKPLRIVKRDRSHTLFNAKIDFGENKVNFDKKLDLPKVNPLANIGKYYNKFDEVNFNK